MIDPYHFILNCFFLEENSLLMLYQSYCSKINLTDPFDDSKEIRLIKTSYVLDFTLRIG